MHYLYKITNHADNDKIYIGQTINPKRRWNNHKAKAGKADEYISRAIFKYGVENFVFEVIAQCLTDVDTNFTEIQLIEQYHSCDKQFGYNIREGGEGGGKGLVHTEEWKQAKSESMQGEKHPMYGKRHTEETKQLIKQSRAKQTMAPWTDERREKIRKTHTGHQPSEETRRKMSEAAKRRAATRVRKPDGTF